MIKSLTFLLAFAVLILVLVAASNPLRRSDDRIKEELLSEMPLGTLMDEVESYIIDQDWVIREIREDTGFLDQRERPFVVTGSKYIRGFLGSYQGIPFEVTVTVYWAFDEQSELIDVWVWKGKDGL